ncbi:MAG TPA: hypothetical protein VFB12_14460 [Ktedonobacteraceae bacterium]|nr:hypothetical protein [Ktedonobacteraceae bacterium]
MQTHHATFPWRIILILLGIVVFCILLASPFIFYQQLRTPETTIVAPTPTPSPTQIPVPSHVTFASFVGQWVAHYGTFTFNVNGQATLEERTYKWCGPGVATPCDSTNGTGLYGLVEKMMFTRVVGNRAYGKITSSNEGDVGKPVTATLLENDTVQVSQGGVYCGPKAPLGWCGH